MREKPRSPSSKRVQAEGVCVQGGCTYSFVYVLRFVYVCVSVGTCTEIVCVIAVKSL